MSRVAAGLALLSLGAMPLAAQSPAPSARTHASAAAAATPGARPWEASAIVGRMEHRVDAGFGVGTSTGSVYGLAVHAARWQLAELDAHVLGGTLEADELARDDRKMGEVAVRASVVPMPWLALVAGATVRGYESTPVTQRWTVIGAGAELRLGFADDRVRTIVRSSLLPKVAVSGSTDPDVGVASAAGVRLDLRRLHASLEYALERYLFPAEPGGADRREQLAGLQVRLGASW